jgi:hypothetical protein
MIDDDEGMLRRVAEVEKVRAAAETPEIVDNDVGDINLILHGKSIRSWRYGDDLERKIRMIRAGEFVNGWIASRERL